MIKVIIHGNPKEIFLINHLLNVIKKQTKSASRRTLSPRKSIQNDDATSIKTEIEEEKDEKIVNSPPIDYWYPPICEQKTKIAITDITSDNVTITFRELI